MDCSPVVSAEVLLQMYEGLQPANRVMTLVLTLQTSPAHSILQSLAPDSGIMGTSLITKRFFFSKYTRQFKLSFPLHMEIIALTSLGWEHV